MKNYRIICVAASLCLLCSLLSCGKKEGRVGHKERIDYIVATENIYYDGVLDFSTGEYVGEKWNWDGKELYRIDYGDKMPYSENIFYDKRNRIIRTTVPAYMIRNEFVYDGRMLDHIDCYKNDELFSRTSITHGDNVITSIVCQYFVAEPADTGIVAVAHNPLNAVLGHNVAKLFCCEQARKTLLDKKKGSKDVAVVEYDLSWSDDNLTHITCVSSEGRKEISLSYDDKCNPYKQLYSYHDLNDGVCGFKMLSENNVTKVIMPYGVLDELVFTYKYEYDGDYPVARTLTYSFPVIDDATWDSVIAKHETVERITYKD